MGSVTRFYKNAHLIAGNWSYTHINNNTFLQNNKIKTSILFIYVVDEC